MTARDPDRWWQRDDLGYRDGLLRFAGHRLDELAAQHRAPVFLYSASRVQANLERLRRALEDAGFGGQSRVFYAMKANRFEPLLRTIAGGAACGIDACSPAEVALALRCGFREEDISFTATSLSRDDFDLLEPYRDVHMNFDSLHALREWGRRRPGSRIGIRVNPAAGVSRADNDKLQYCGGTVTKFGIYQEQFEAAMEICHQAGLTVSTIHFHTGCGYLSPELGRWSAVLESCLWFLDHAPDATRVNVGGGLGVPHMAEDVPLDLAAWGDILRRHFLDRALEIQVEPGDYLVKDAGVLLLEITYDELKRDRRFVGVNGGFSIAPEPAHYGLPFQPVPLHQNMGPRTPATVAGNINEALDVWYTETSLPDLSGETHLALVNAGAYSSSMASNHCMRGDFTEILLDPR